MNFYFAGSGARRDRITDGIFDDGLKDEVGNMRVERVGVNVDMRGETILKTYAHDVQIAAEEFYLLLERDLLCAGVFQREAQEIPEPRNHLARGLGVFVQEGRDG